jgi:hypothetical protein
MQLQDTQRSTFQATGSGVVFQVSVPVGDDVAGRTAAAAAELVSAFDAAAEVPGVAAMSTGQDVDLGGNLMDVVTVAVTSTSGRASTQITVPLSAVKAGQIGAQVAAARADLDALEGL